MVFNAALRRLSLLPPSSLANCSNVVGDHSSVFVVAVVEIEVTRFHCLLAVHRVAARPHLHPTEFVGVTFAVAARERTIELYKNKNKTYKKLERHKGHYKMKTLLPDLFVLKVYGVFEFRGCLVCARARGAALTCSPWTSGRL